MASGRVMSTNYTERTQDKVERADVLEPDRPGFESQFHYLVELTVNKLLFCLNSSCKINTTYLEGGL